MRHAKEAIINTESKPLAFGRTASGQPRLNDDLRVRLQPHEEALRRLLVKEGAALTEVSHPLLLAWETVTEGGSRPERRYAFWEWFRSLPGSRALHGPKAQNLLQIERVLIRKHGLDRERVTRLGYCKARDLARVIGADIPLGKDESEGWIRAAEAARTVAEFQRLCRGLESHEKADRQVFMRLCLSEAVAEYLRGTIELAKDSKIGDTQSDSAAIEYICHEFRGTYNGWNNEGDPDALLCELLFRIQGTFGVTVTAHRGDEKGDAVLIFGPKYLRLDAEEDE
ncbi:MAG: hypothetical protein L6R43_04500 [Planctomycetes bacterium]|nr:hypothetical protein [Planctomycetota bacterium]